MSYTVDLELTYDEVDVTAYALKKLGEEGWNNLIDKMCVVRRLSKQAYERSLRGRHRVE